MAYRDNSGDDERRTYIYKKCLSCRVKVNIMSTICWKCGQKVEDMTYGSHNPNDAIYGWELNRGDMCVSCPVTQRGKTCRYLNCFGLGREKCDMCREFEGHLFECCQDKQRREKEWEETHGDIIAKYKEVMYELH